MLPSDVCFHGFTLNSFDYIQNYYEYTKSFDYTQNFYSFPKNLIGNIHKTIVPHRTFQKFETFEKLRKDIQRVKPVRFLETRQVGSA